MTGTEPRQRVRKPKAADKGRYKLGVYFHNHDDKNGRAKYFWSNTQQDKKGISVNRLKKMVTVKWQGKVNWAAIYENGIQVCKFNEETQWTL